MRYQKRSRPEPTDEILALCALALRTVRATRVRRAMGLARGAPGDHLDWLDANLIPVQSQLTLHH